RVLGLSRFGSFVAGVSYALGGFVVSRAGFLSMTSTAPWLPLILAVTETMLQRRTPSPGDGGKRGKGEKGKRMGTGDLSGWTVMLFALGSLAVGLQLLAGHGQLAFYSLLLVVAYGLYRSWQLGSLMEITASSIVSEPPYPAKASTSWGSDKDVEALAGKANFKSNRNRGSSMCAWAGSFLPVPAMIVLGLGIAAIQMLPTLELAINSVRAGGVGYDFAMAYSLYSWQLVSLIAPDFFGNPATGDYWGPGAYWEISGYIGVLPLLAGGIGLLVPAKRARLPRLFFFGVAVVSLVFALGPYLPVYPFVFSHVPGFDLFQAPARFLFWYALAAAVLAGIGCDALLARAGSPGPGRLGRVVFVAGAGLTLAMAAFFVFPGQSEGVRPTFIGALTRLGILLTIAGLLLSTGCRLPGRWWQFCLGLYVVTDLLLFGLPLNPTTLPDVYDEGQTTVTNFLRGGEGIYRVYTPDAAFLKKFFTVYSFRTFGATDPSSVRQVSEKAIPNFPMAWRLQESYNYDPLRVGAAHEFLQAVDASSLDSRLLSLMNVRYVLSDTVSPVSQLKLVVQAPGPVYENLAPLDRAFFVEQAVMVSSTKEALRAVEKPDFDPRRTVILSQRQPIGVFGLLLDWLGGFYPVSPSFPVGRSEKQGTTLVEYAPQRVVVETMFDRAGYLVVSDTYYPGWKAWVNGKSARIWQADGAFRALEVPPGPSVVEIRYEPVAFKAGLLVTILSLVLVLAVTLWTTIRRKAS
ncbi:MAG: YfhO family protein, partial [Dehalococcoidia bacterium]|nr:YfhO family protein [Dehalococcoidia bacterium]